MSAKVYLSEILDWHRRRAASDPRPFEQLLEEARAAPRAKVAGFAETLARPGPQVIAEIKRRSPSKGDLRPGLDPAAIASGYEHGGASCMSVLTDREFFAGSPADLQAARAACSLPALRKDFTVCLADICDARIMGADAVLVIVAALSPAEIRDFMELARELGMDALVETHDQAEIELAAELGADLIGINQRNLNTFEVDRQLAAKLHPHLPADAVKVAESAIRGPEDATALFEVGYDAVLVGESFITAADPGEAVREFLAQL